MKRVLSILSMLTLLALPMPLVAADVNWGSVQPQKVKLFYPGVASWEFLNSKDHGVGMVPVVKRKKGCPECHIDKAGNLDVRAAEIVNGSLSMKTSKKPFEPTPLGGKPGFMDVDLQAAYDSDTLYLRFQWSSSGKTWKGDSGSPDRVSVQLNSGQDEFSKYGCFVTCHPDQNSMPDSASKDKVGKHPYYSKQKRDDVRLYAFYSRTEDGGWAGIKGGKELDDLAKTGIIDLWEATFKPNGLDIIDGWLFEDREADSSKDVEGSGSYENGNYTVVLKRKLKTQDAKDVEIKDGASFTIGIAVHNDKAKLRSHYVSYPVSIGLGVDGTVKATKLK